MSAARQKGTKFETSLLPLLSQHYPGAERRAMQGRNDKGDYLLPSEHRFVLEAKNVAKYAMPQWHAEAAVEAANAGVRYGVVVHKRRGHSDPAAQWVTLTLGDFLDLVGGG